ncbi:hypothetical protein INT48_003634 [Thamnidium elegans]|uniref:NAD(P)-binding domain-containing protein n=1 Tax=Thamnidium elegans TaxID=101142 RepID=A0A8H7SSE4_9FUNG|nr:hypothetical protein INT48_003634 [Thamnidium elegans]
MLLIPFADDYLGYCITSHLSQIKSLRPEMRVLYSTKSPWIHNFESKGIEARAIGDYTHPHQLSQAMRNVDQLILTLGSHSERVLECQQICKVALKSGVKSIVFLSHQGGQSESHSLLYDYGLVENYLIQQQEEDEKMNWTIVRLDWIQQYFHLWASQVDQTRTMSLPLSSDTEICPIDITDVCLVLEKLVLDDDQKLLSRLDDNHVGQVYTCTGPESVTSKDLMQMMSNATSYDSFKYLMARAMDTKFYLNNLGRNIWFDARIKNEKNQAYHDLLETNSYRTKVLVVPNDIQVQTFLDYFDWVLKTSSSIPVDHIKLFSRSPKTMQDFFYENAVDFKPKV